VRSIVSARIDRLGDREKHVLQAASVIGKRFEARLLEPITELDPVQVAEALRALSDAEFIYEESESVSSEYAFRHPLTQEVAYDSQLRDRRARLHAALAQELAELSPEKLDENAPLLSHHWEQAGELLEAARWRRRAATRVAESSPVSAREHWRKIIALLDEQDEGEEAAELMIQACTNVLLLSFVAGVSTDELTGVYYRGRTLAEATENTRALALLTGVYGLAAGASTGELPIYIRHAREALELAEQAGETAVLMISSLLLGSALFLVKQLPESLQVFRRGLEASQADPTRRELGEDVFHLHLLVQHAEAQGHMGEPRSAIERIEQLLPRVRELEATTLEMLALLGHTSLLQILGETEAAERDATRARAIAETHGAPSLRIFAQQISGMANEMRGDWGAAESCFATALSLSEEHRTAVWSQPLYLAHRARDLAQLDEVEQARATAAGALQRSHQLGTEREHVLLTLASILIQGGNPEDRREIEACLDEVEASITASGYSSIRPELHLERARLARASGDADRAQRELERARRLLVAMGAKARAASLNA
jgi:tetratricopeptide (TPR) repeat protein